MQANVGGVDRAARIVVGVTLLGATLMGAIGAWVWLGGIPLATGLFGFCPAYPLLGMNTCKLKK